MTTVNSTRGRSVARFFRRLPVWIVVAILLVIVVYPLVWLLLGSLKTQSEFLNNPTWALPEDWTNFSNYVTAWVDGNLGQYFLNSILAVVPSLAITIFVGVAAGFALEVMIWKGRGNVLLYFLAGIMIPGQMILLPLFNTYFRLHLTGTLWPLIITYTAIGLPLTVFMMATFFRAVPRDVFEAATLDGASIYRMFFSIGFPMVRNAIFTVALVQFFFIWNDLLIALTFTTERRPAHHPGRTAQLPGRVRSGGVRPDVRSDRDQRRPDPHHLPLPEPAGHEGHDRRRGQGVSALTDPQWVVDWVSPSSSAEIPEVARGAALLRAEFELAGEIREARVHATAHGVFDLEVNGRPASDELLAPGWSSYRHRVRFRTLDVSGLLTSGPNALGLWLADGWYRGRLGFNGGVWDNYGTDTAALIQLEVRDERGWRVVPLTWSVGESPIGATGLYEGEAYDARLEQPGGPPGFDDRHWTPAQVLPRSAFGADIVEAGGEPIRVIEKLGAVSRRRTDDGRIIFDFGQNIAGKLQFRGKGIDGRQVRLRHAEVLEQDGELALRPLRSASSVDTYTFADDRDVTWTPRFTVHGFRYAELTGWPVDADDLEVEALVVHSDMRRTGWFETDHALLDTFHENVVWSMRDNFVGLPTDCPQRDERLGWTGDIQVFAPTAAFLYDVNGVLGDWLADLAAEQAEAGSVLNFHPWIECGFPSEPAAAWGDAAVIVPWTLYERTGDVAILRRQFDSMRAWVDQVFELTHESGYWGEGFQLGDWLDPAAPGSPR